MRHYAPAPVEKALPFITQLAGAIDFARAAGIGHGGAAPARHLCYTRRSARHRVRRRRGARAGRHPRAGTPPLQRARTDRRAAVGHAGGRVLARRDHLRAAHGPAARRHRRAKRRAARRSPSRSDRAVLARAMDRRSRASRTGTALAFAAALEAAWRGEELEQPQLSPSAVSAVAPLADAAANAPAPPAPAPPAPAPAHALESPPAPAHAPAPPGEFTVEKQLDPVAAALKDATTRVHPEAPTSGGDTEPTLFDRPHPSEAAEIPAGSPRLVRRRSDAGAAPARSHFGAIHGRLRQGTGRAR